MNKRRLLTILAIILHAAAAIWWVLYFPEEKDLLYRAVPPQAVFVSEHDRLGERWPEICTNPFVTWLWEISGSPPEKARASACDPALAKLLRWLAHRRTVTCYVPHLGPSGWPAWIIASSSGWRGQIAHAVFASGRVHGFKRTTAGIRTWWVSDSDFSSWRTSATLVRGVVIVCFSRDPSAARYVADRMEQNFTLFPQLENRLSESRTDPTPDRGWLDAGLVGSQYSGTILPFELSVKNSGETLIRIIGSVPAEKTDRPLLEMDMPSQIRRLFPKDPEALALIPSSLFSRVFLNLDPGRRFEAMLQFPREQSEPGTPLLAAVFAGDLCGRIFGLKVPTLAVGTRMGGDGIKDQDLLSWFDHINSRYGLNLVATRPEGGRANTFLIGLANNPLWGTLKADDQPAVVSRAGWLLFFSNAAAAERMASPLVSIRPVENNSEWHQQMPAERNAVGFLWIDFEKANKSLRDALAVASLAVELHNSGGVKRRLRPAMDEARAWLRAAVTLRSCALWIVPSDIPQTYDIVLKVGRSL